jgi:hypothetical protein
MPSNTAIPYLTNLFEMFGDPHQAHVGVAERHPPAARYRIVKSIRARSMEVGQHPDPAKQTALQ